MYKFTTLGNEPRQQVTMILNDASRVVFTFEYKANQLGWFFSYTYNRQTVANIRLTTSYNMLRSYKPLPFGLRCDTTDGLEPMEITDFSSGYASVYLLTQEDINAIESRYYAKVGS